MQGEFKRLARVLRQHRKELATGLLESFEGWDKYPEAASPDESVRAGFVERELVVFIDYLALYFASADQSYLDLYVGEKLKQCHDPKASAAETLHRQRSSEQKDRKSFMVRLEPILDAGEQSAFLQALDQIAATLGAEATVPVRVLFVGDCLHIDVVSFLARPLVDAGLRLESRFLTSKNPVELLRSLRELADENFDLIFFSPFSYEFHLEYAQLLYLRTALLPGRRIRALVESAQRDAENTLTLLTDIFPSPIFVHNSSGIRRHDRSLLERTKNLLTMRARSYARNIANEWLAGLLQKQGAELPRRLFPIDEAALLQQHSEDRLGRCFYGAELQHPAELGRSIAGLYLDAMVATAVYAKKKLIVCDLDNTLWRGVIGEGPVEHILDRQQTLKQLRNRGMLLAINSKNDSRNLTWDGALLSDEDFVSRQINWSPKTENMRRIASELNLKTKDFLFLDDRAEERAIMQEVMPEVLCVDPDAAGVWRRLQLVPTLLPKQDELDRTLTYHQQAKRQQALHATQQDVEDQSPVLRKLEIGVHIRAAAAKDLERVVELINRTNQFNLCGSRTYLAEAKRWQQSPRHRILMVDAQDKFGKMGAVSVAVVARTSDCLDILVFVLSCRAFGFGIETALLNTVRHIADCASRIAGGLPLPVHGRYIETPANDPCRHVYQRHGFALAGDAWVYHCGASVHDPEHDPDQDPEWLSVTREPIEGLAISG